jgi:c-di-GMP-binding flagellar brake protein YcgR
MTDRREFFRIKDRLEVEYREVDREEYLELEREIRYRPSQTYGLTSLPTHTENGRKREDDKDMVVSYLKLIDQKVSAILDMLAKDDPDGSRTRPFTARYGEVDISGAGLSFILDTPLTIGTLLHVRMMLPIFPYPAVQALCEAVRHGEVSIEESPCCMNALKFLVINDLDRDLLISYVFDREREQIRLQKTLDNG